jgi:hypothetical protein
MAGPVPAFLCVPRLMGACLARCFSDIANAVVAMRRAKLAGRVLHLTGFHLQSC